MKTALLERGHGDAIDGIYIDAPNKMSPEPPPNGVFEGNLNSWILQEISSSMMSMGMDAIDINSHSLYNCPTLTRRNSINKFLKMASGNNTEYYCLSIHNNALGKKWQKKLADTRVLYNPLDSEGKKLAESIVSELIAIGRSAIIKARPGLALLGLRCPEALIECCWMDNQDDIEWIKTNMVSFSLAVALGCKKWSKK